MKSFPPNATPISADGVDLKEICQFTYLGCNVANDGEVRSKNGVRIGKAGAAYRIMNKVWKYSGTSLKTDIKLYDSIVIIILLYSSES